MYNQNQAQGQPTNKTLTNANAMKAQSMESSSELSQSSGEISRLLLAKAKSGMEFGSFSRSQGSGTSSEYSNQSELNSSSGQTTRMLANQVKK